MDVKLYPAPLAGLVAAPPSKSRWHRELICQAAAGPFSAGFPQRPGGYPGHGGGLAGLIRWRGGGSLRSQRQYPALPAAVSYDAGP